MICLEDSNMSECEEYVEECSKLNQRKKMAL